MVIDRRTSGRTGCDTQTNEPSTVTLAAHERQGLIISAVYKRACAVEKFALSNRV